MKKKRNKNEEIELKTGLYLRVSTEEQATTGYSIEGQEDKLRAYAAIMNWDIVDIYIDTQSGKDIEGRKEIKRMLKDVQSGRIKNIVVWKLDRLTRSIRDLLDIVDLLTENDCEFNSLIEKIDTTTATGRMFLKILGIFAEFERENLSERVRLGFERKTNEGYVVSSYKLAYGYTKIDSKNIDINREQANIVSEIYDKFYYQDYNYTQIANILNNHGVPSPTNGHWAAAAIRYVLMNRIYAGKVVINGKEKEGKHTAIIDNQLSLAVIEKTKKIAREPYKKPAKNNYFAGVLYCSLCGAKLNVHNVYYLKNNTTERVYLGQYSCKNRKSDINCQSPHMSHLKIEKAFFEYIGNIKIDEKILKQADLSDKSMYENENEIDDLKKMLKNLMEKRKEITQKYISNYVAFKDYMKIVNDIDIKTQDINTEIKDLETERLQDIKTSKKESVQHIDILKNMKESFLLLTIKEKRHFVKKYISKITVASKIIENKKQVVIEDISFHSEDFVEKENGKSNRIKTILK